MTDAAPLWTGLGLVGPLQARVSGEVPTGVTGVSIDTRTLVPGDLFFAIKGEAHDGHDHVFAAVAAGAAAAVVDEAHADALRGLCSLYVVRDVLPAMERLGRAARARSGARVVAVTGSVGKTSTKEALRLVLGHAGATHASAASYNNHWGVPLTLARMPAETRFGVFEIGMNHAGEITPLVDMVRPHIAIVTTVAPVHLAHFDSEADIAQAKGEIFSGVVGGGAAIIHRDIPHFVALAALADASPARHILSFGEREGDAHLVSLDLGPDGSRVEADVLGTRVRYRLGAPGRHMALNSLAVLLAAKAMGVDVADAAAALADFAPPPGRGGRHTLSIGGEPLTLIDESYNANPASMRAALSVLGATPPGVFGRRIAVLGDMLELGAHGPDLHRELAQAVADAKVDLVFAAGPLMRGLYDALPQERRGLWAHEAGDIERDLLAAVQGGDVVMVKGSNGSRMAPLVAALRQRFAGPLPAQR